MAITGFVPERYNSKRMTIAAGQDARVYSVIITCVESLAQSTRFVLSINWHEKFEATF